MLDLRRMKKDTQFTFRIPSDLKNHLEEMPRPKVAASPKSARLSCELELAATGKRASAFSGASCHERTKRPTTRCSALKYFRGSFISWHAALGST